MIRTYKLNGDRVTEQMLNHRVKALAANGYPKAKWIRFCEVLMAEGYALTIYEARRTVSKYITVMYPGAPSFKVRFSNHRPIAEREAAGDCDFFVGRTNLAVTHSRQALDAVRKHFGRPALVKFTEPVVEMFDVVEEDAH